MPQAAKVNYLKALVICHGKSEVEMVRYISTNLHLNVKQYAKNKGKSSIQITSLTAVLNSAPFNSMKAFTEEYAVETSGRGANKKLCNFKLFIVMDTDDCTEQQKADYISKRMFEGHWLYDYIVPIYNVRNLEDVLLDCKVIDKQVRNSEKGAYYKRIFPINARPLSDDTVYDIKTFKEKIAGCKNTNLTVLIDFCLSLVG